MFLLSILIAMLAIVQGLSFEDNNVFPTLLVGRDGIQTYFVNANFGNPVQSQRLTVDLMLPYTTLVSGRAYPECNTVKYTCSSGGLYYPEHSYSHVNLSDNALYNLSAISYFNITYSMGSDYAELPTVRYTAEHSLTLGDSSVYWNLTKGLLRFERFSFFQSEYSSVVSATLGLGGKISVGSDVLDNSNYDDSFFFLDSVKTAGLISSCSYSLWLGDDVSGVSDFLTTHESVGSVVLGGVDPQYYTGDIYQYETLPYYDPLTDRVARNYPILPLSKVNLINSTGAFTNLTGPDFNEPVLLDTKSAVSYLPPELFTQVASQTRGYYDRGMRALFVDCSVADINATLSFEFGDAAINVPLSHFVMHTTPNVVENNNRFNQTCYLQISPNTETGFTILGPAFLRSVYLIMDLEGGTIALAQSKNPHDTSFSAASPSITPAAISSGRIPYAKSASVNASLTLSVRQDNLGLRGGVNATTKTEGGILTKSFYSTFKATSTSGTSTTTTHASGEFHSPNGAHMNARSLHYFEFFLTHLSSFTEGFIALGIIVMSSLV